MNTMQQNNDQTGSQETWVLVQAAAHKLAV